MLKEVFIVGVITDPIADMLTRIRNALQARKASVEIPASKIKREIARILKEEGYVGDVQFIERGPQGVIKIQLKYGPRQERVISGLQRVSHPGRRIYVKAEEIPLVRRGLGIAILSTSKGIMTDREARKLKVGGEVICYVW
ncbi:MAG: 30S ribosomal protein S8 [Armatimonadota bacterium]|nr:30S ribosomal protein S8 [Armatimonadota bacterium]MDR5702367.1 30S ribosomal protein S8 [Armatimonadota bacterium]MDR7435460.1 30S ribosomal protein S8 [Armatimonadota bacterium]